MASPCPDGEYCVDGTCSSPPNGMAAVPAGVFVMGCNEELDDDCDNDEFPAHEVQLDAFAIDRYEVTVDDYTTCMNAGGCSIPAYDYVSCVDWSAPEYGLHPIDCISWLQARAYCTWRSKRLPTEAEWEMAARGTDGRRYPWGNEAPTCSLANYSDCGGSLVAVGNFPAGASPYGVLDLAGNVFEWVSDWHGPGYYVESPYSNPTGPDSGLTHGGRGGAYNTGVHNLRTSDRAYSDAVTGGLGLDEDHGAVAVGFRCAATP